MKHAEEFSILWPMLFILLAHVYNTDNRGKTAVQCYLEDTNIKSIHILCNAL